MKMHVYEDERWPTLVVEKPSETMLKQKYFQDSIIDMPDELLRRYEAANKELKAVEELIGEMLDDHRKQLQSEQ